MYTLHTQYENHTKKTKKILVIFRRDLVCCYICCNLPTVKARSQLVAASRCNDHHLTTFLNQTKLSLKCAELSQSNYTNKCLVELVKRVSSLLLESFVIFRWLQCLQPIGHSKVILCQDVHHRMACHVIRDTQLQASGVWLGRRSALQTFAC